VLWESRCWEVFHQVSDFQSTILIYNMILKLNTPKGSLVIDHLSELSRNNVSCGIIWFYFDYNDENQRAPAKIVCSLLQQALAEVDQSADVDIPEDIRRDLEKAQKTGRNLELDEAFTFLERVLLQFRKVYILIDALDECDERNVIPLLRPLQKMLGYSDTTNLQQSTRIFVTGRPHTERQVQQYLSRSTNPTSFTLEAHTEDIERFILHKIETEVCDIDIKDNHDLKTEIATQISSRSDGMLAIQTKFRFYKLTDANSCMSVLGFCYRQFKLKSS
jgi:hypothetical protein